MMRLFITEKIKALIFIIFAVFSFISLISFSPNDPGINYVGNNNEITNIMGLFGAYFASILYAFLGYSSYLIPIFFITHGFVSLVRNKKGSISIKLMFLLFGIIFLNYSAYILDNNFSLLSIFLNNISGSYLEEIFYSKFFNQLISIFLGLVSVFFIMYSININLKYFSRETNTIYSPKLEVEWDDSSFSTGSSWMAPVSASEIDQLTGYFKNLRPEYKEKSKARIRFAVKNLEDERAPTADRYYGYYADAHQDYGRYYYVDFQVKMK